MRLSNQTPAVFVGMGADTFAAAADAASLDDLFLRLEDAGVMLRIDPAVLPSMARAPTLAVWELDLLQTVENVVRMGRIRGVERGTMTLDQGVVPIAARRGSRALRCRRIAAPADGSDLG